MRPAVRRRHPAGCATAFERGGDAGRRTADHRPGLRRRHTSVIRIARTHRSPRPPGAHVLDQADRRARRRRVGRRRVAGIDAGDRLASRAAVGRCLRRGHRRSRAANATTARRHRRRPAIFACGADGAVARCAAGSPAGRAFGRRLHLRGDADVPDEFSGRLSDRSIGISADRCGACADDGECRRRRRPDCLGCDRRPLDCAAPHARLHRRCHRCLRVRGGNFSAAWPHAARLPVARRFSAPPRSGGTASSYPGWQGTLRRTGRRSPAPPVSSPSPASCRARRFRAAGGYRLDGYRTGFVVFGVLCLLCGAALLARSR